MLSFAPGELSTIDGHLLDRLFNPGHQPTQTNTMTKPFNPADLPCPPRSVMENQWYKPEPGEPYRPLIAAPKQFSSWNKLFASCKPTDFTAVDPPRALIQQKSMVAGGPSAAQPASVEASATIAPGSFLSLIPPSPAPILDGATTETNSPNLVPSPSKQNDPQQGGQPPFQSQGSYGKSNGEAPDPQGPDPHNSDSQGGSSQGSIPNNQNKAPWSPGQSSGKVSSGQPPADSNNPDQAYGSGSAEQDYGAPGSGLGYHIIQQLSGTSPNSDKLGEGVVIDGKTVRPGSAPVSVSGGSQVIVDGAGRDVVIGDHILPMSPHLSNEDARAPVVTLLPNGERAVLSWPVPSAKNKNAILSIYGMVLTAGGPAITVATGTASGHPILATLSLDSQLDLIYNPTVQPLQTLAPSLKQTNPPETLAYGKDPITTSILKNQPLIVLADGEGISIAGTTLYYPTSLQTNPAGSNKSPEMVVSGTTIALIGTIALVVGGTQTVTLPTVAPTPIAYTNISNESIIAANSTSTFPDSESFTGDSTPLLWSSVSRTLQATLLTVWSVVILT